MSRDSDKKQLAEAKVPGLESTVRIMRSNGASWRTIEASITVEGMTVSYEAWRRWYPDKQATTNN